MGKISKKVKHTTKDDAVDSIDENTEKKNDGDGKMKVISAQLKKRMSTQKKRQKKLQRGVILIRHLPKQFLEEQIKNYFKQFGHVTRVRLARSVKTGGPKGFAFVEFAVPEVAEIAADTMNNYLLFKKLVKAHYIPPDEQKYDYFKSGIRLQVTPSGKKIHISGYSKARQAKVDAYNNWNDENYSSRMKKAMKKVEKMRDKCSKLGINLNDFIVAPKLRESENKSSELDAAQKADVAQDDDDDEIDSKEETNKRPGSLLLIKKSKAKKSNLEMLMDDTIEETSEDSDYEPDDSLDNTSLTENVESNLKLLVDKTIEESSEDSDYEPEDSSDGSAENGESKLSMLMDDTIVDSSDDSDYEQNSSEDESDENTESKLKLLMEKTIEESSEDSDFEPQNSSDESVSEDVNTDDDEVQMPLLKKKKLVGGIQKSKNKILSKKKEKKAKNIKNSQLKTEAAKAILSAADVKLVKKENIKKKK